MRNVRWIMSLALATLLAGSAASGAAADTRGYYSVPGGTSQQQNFYKPNHGDYYYVGDVKYTWSDNQNRWVCTTGASSGSVSGGVYYSGDGSTGSTATTEWQGSVNAYEYTAPTSAYGTTGGYSGSVYVPPGAALSQPNTQCEDLPSAFTFTINGVPVTVTNAAYSKDGVSQVYSPANGTQLPWYGTANGSGVQEYPTYTTPTYTTPTYTTQTYTAPTYSTPIYSDPIYTTQTTTAAQTCPTPTTAGGNNAASAVPCFSANGYFGTVSPAGTACVLDGNPCVLGVCPNNGYCQTGNAVTGVITGSQQPTYTQPQTGTPVQPNSPTQTGGGILSQAAAATPAIAAMEQTSLALLNAERQANGLAPLAMDPTLNTLARLKSQDMAAEGYFAHESENYGSVSDMLDAAGVRYSGVGENLAHHEDVYTANNALMSSAGHRQNILGSQWTKAGVGVALDSNGYPLITQIFAR